MSFRAEGKNPEWDPARLKRNYPKALPVYSVQSEKEANMLITNACAKGWGTNRHGLPHILQEDVANMDAVSNRLREVHALMKEPRRPKQSPWRQNEH